MSLLTKNYSQSKINQLFINYSYIERRTSTSDRSLDVFYDLEIDLDWLDFQARTFSTCYSTHGYLNFFKVMKCKPEDVGLLLTQVYIYSFVKCFYNGIYNSDMSHKTNFGLAFKGHVDLFNVIRSSSNTGYFGETMFSTNLRIGDKKRKDSQMFRIFRRFPFLSEFKNYQFSSFGSVSFSIPKYETILNSFAYDYLSSIHVEQGKVTTGTSDAKQVKRNDYPTGRLHLADMNDSQSAILAFNNFPLLNAFKDKSNNFYFIPTDEKNPLENNASVFFCKANFITLNSIDSDMSKITKIYNSVGLTAETNHFVCSEVYTITGIKCRNYPAPSQFSEFVIPSVDDIYESIRTKSDNFSSKLVLKVLGLDVELDDITDEMYNILFPDRRVK